MGGVEDDRRPRFPHNREGAHIGNQVVVAEAHASLANHNGLVPRGPRLIHHVRHVPRRQELALFDIHGPPHGTGTLDEVGLAAKKGGGLEDVDNAGNLFHGRIFVNVRQHGNGEGLLNVLKHLKPGLQPRTAIAGMGGTVRLIKARFIDKRDAQAFR